ncbi:MAG: ribonuclease J [Oscillospiraceae bacterium]|nr:ribonuclease J [Oscillospiraceae bacterium]
MQPICALKTMEAFVLPYLLSVLTVRKPSAKQSANELLHSSFCEYINSDISVYSPHTAAAERHNAAFVYYETRYLLNNQNLHTNRNAGQSPDFKPRKYTPAQNAEQKLYRNPKRNPKYHEQHRASVRIIPLGGLNEIGKNMTVFECSNDMFILDCGLAFPDAEMPGVDIVIPDFSYVIHHKDKLRGIVITHGHEDHIGGLAYLLKKVNAPVYGSAMTIGLIKHKLEEHGILNKVPLHVMDARKTMKMGCMTVEFIKVNHSIPGSMGVIIYTPAGVMVHTGDFKVDFSPVDGERIDLGRFGELGNKGVLALMADSTNAERAGYTPSESKVGASFEKLFAKAGNRRIIIATFSSNIHRVQQIINMAAKTKRKVAVLGRSMVNVIATALELGYLEVPKNIIIDIETIDQYAPEQLVLITTGSQGEPMSALTRMAMHDHNKINITPLDFIILSATPIPGNEKHVTKVVNELLKSGAEVIYESMYDVHVSGHACQEELKLMLALTRPKFFIPMHGEYKHLVKHRGLALEMGIPKENILLASIGNVIETDGSTMQIVGQVPAGRTLVDGLGVGDVGSIVLRDRKHLSEDGLIIIIIGIQKTTNEIVAGPDIVSRGFVYVREAEDMMVQAKLLMKRVLDGCSYAELREWASLKTKLRDKMSEFIFEQTKRSPMILPIIMEI